MYLIKSKTEQANKPQVFLNQVKQKVLITRLPQEQFKWLLIQAIMEGSMAQAQQTELKKAA